MKTLGISIIAGVVLFGATLLYATDYYVDRDNPTPQPPYTNDWSAAATNIQFAVDAASAGDTVWVAPGRYTVPTNFVTFEGTNVVYIDKPLALRASGTAAETIIDGGGSNRGIMVYYDADSDELFTIAGLSVTNCRANNGAGIRFGLSGNDWTGVVDKCVVADNLSMGAGGGIYNTAAALIVTDSTIRGNEVVTGTGGAGIYDLTAGPLIVSGSRIESNVATGGTAQEGGGIWCRSGDMTIENTVISRNVALSGGNANTGGGGIYRRSSGTVTLRNCLLSGNAGYKGGALHVQESVMDLSIFNCTIVSNTGGEGPINFRKSGYAGSRYVLYNTIIYSNSLDNIKLPDEAGTVIGFTNCCTFPDTDVTGSGNITDWPDFIDFDGGNYRLPKDSPCVNEGYNQLWMNSALDLDGYPRIDTSVGVVDMGCYEVQYRGTMVTIQ